MGNMTNTNYTATSNTLARQALAIGRSSAGGSVTSAVQECVRTRGRCNGLSGQAWVRLRHAVSEALPHMPSRSDLDDACEALIRAEEIAERQAARAIPRRTVGPAGYVSSGRAARPNN